MSETEYFGLAIMIFLIHITNITVMYTPFAGSLSIVKYVIFAMSYLLILIYMWRESSTKKDKDFVAAKDNMDYILYVSTSIYLIVWVAVLMFSEDSLNNFFDNISGSLKLT